MNGFSAIIPRISASVPVLADILVAVLLSWIDLTLYNGVGLRSLDGCGDGPLARHSPGVLLLER